MFVAYELRKTLYEIEAMSLDELSKWLAFFKIKQARTDKAMARRGRR